jgi:hypothetical protein
MFCGVVIVRGADFLDLGRVGMGRWALGAMSLRYAVETSGRPPPGGGGGNGSNMIGLYPLPKSLLNSALTIFDRPHVLIGVERRTYARRR